MPIMMRPVRMRVVDGELVVVFKVCESLDECGTNTTHHQP
jgi:hypothetical protein